MELVHSPNSSSIFTYQYQKHIAEGNWKPRTDAEIAILTKNQHLLIHKNSIIGGASISPTTKILLEHPALKLSYQGYGTVKLQIAIYGRLIECLWRNTNSPRRRRFSSRKKQRNVSEYSALCLFQKWSFLQSRICSY